jgi:hypothetical protein
MPPGVEKEELSGKNLYEILYDYNDMPNRVDSNMAIWK